MLWKENMFTVFATFLKQVIQHVQKIHTWQQCTWNHSFRHTNSHQLSSWILNDATKFVCHKGYCFMLLLGFLRYIFRTNFSIHVYSVQAVMFNLRWTNMAHLLPVAFESNCTCNTPTLTVHLFVGLVFFLLELPEVVLDGICCFFNFNRAERRNWWCATCAIAGTGAWEWKEARELKEITMKSKRFFEWFCD